MTVLDAAPAPEKVRVMNIGDAADLYLGELEGDGRTPRTVDRYRRVLQKLYNDYQHVDVDEITSVMVRRHLEGYRINAKKPGRVPNSPATRAQIASIIRSFFAWLEDKEYIKRSPAERIKRPKLQSPHENDHVLTISNEDVRKLLTTARTMGWPTMLAVYLAVHTGARRHALSAVRWGDYDMVEAKILFHEKGGKVIRKSVALDLAGVLNAAFTAGLYESDDDYLIPSQAIQRRDGVRDDRVIWRLIKECAREAKVTTHVHALRAAFAVHYLEAHPDNVVALQELMGHKRLDTTLIYLRRYNREQAMETVRDLSWGVDSGYGRPELFDAHQSTEKEGFEPSFKAREASGGEGTL